MADTQSPASAPTSNGTYATGAGGGGEDPNRGGGGGRGGGRRIRFGDRSQPAEGHRINGESNRGPSNGTETAVQGRQSTQPPANPNPRDNQVEQHNTPERRPRPSAVVAALCRVDWLSQEDLNQLLTILINRWNRVNRANSTQGGGANNTQGDGSNGDVGTILLQTFLVIYIK
ncbi:hypothetical protein FQN54_004111 [Arachnomyces sp. PD_36]|nr:hypothetical protein FQN54_004111 [Arachnomyces sp. PD_36]